jgi:hypothetical protein
MATRALTVTSKTNGAILYQTFEERLKAEYNRNGYCPVELALIALERDSSWNQKIVQIQSGTIGPKDQQKLEKRVHLQLARLPEEASQSNASEQRPAETSVTIHTTSEAFQHPIEDRRVTAIGVLFFATIILALSCVAASTIYSRRHHH